MLTESEQALVIEDDSSVEEEKPREPRKADDVVRPEPRIITEPLSQDANVRSQNLTFTKPQSLAQTKGLTTAPRELVPKPRSKKLLPLSLVPKGKRSLSHRFQNHRKNRGSLERSTSRRLQERSYEDEGKLALRRPFNAAFPLRERQIPAYNSLVDKHVRIRAKFQLQKHLPQLSSAEPSKAFVEQQKKASVTQPTEEKLKLPRMTCKKSDSESSGGLQWSYRDNPVKGKDWGMSVLDGYAAAGDLMFNSEAKSSFLTEEELYHLLDLLKDSSTAIQDIERLIEKGSATLKRLRKELLLAEDLSQPEVHISRNGLLTLLLQCDSHLQTRRLVLEILYAIHKREACLLALMHPSTRTGPSPVYSDFISHSHSILVLVAQLKARTGDPGFTYLGTEVVTKVYKDAYSLPEAWKGQCDFGEEDQA